MRTALTLGVALLLAGAVPARAQAPTADEIVERAKARGVGPQAERLRQHFLPGARLVAGGSTRLGGSRLGGRPDMPRGMRWPSCRRHRLSFLMQVDLAELAAAAPGQVGGGGHLLVFGDLRETPDGLTQIELTYGRLHRGGCVQLRHFTGQNLVRRNTPRRTRKLRSMPVALRPTLTTPSLDGAEWLLRLRRPLRPWEAWIELGAEAAQGLLGRQAPLAPVHQLLGWPSPVQVDPTLPYRRPRGTPPSRRLLVQLDYDLDLRFDIGDGGALYLTIPSVDLRAGRFDRVDGEMQEY
jgi:hypothetical protein